MNSRLYIPDAKLRSEIMPTKIFDEQLQVKKKKAKPRLKFKKINLSHIVLHKNEDKNIQNEEESIQNEEENIRKEEENIQKEEENIRKEEENIQKEEENIQKEEENIQKEEENIQKEEENIRKEEENIQKEKEDIQKEKENIQKEKENIQKEKENIAKEENIHKEENIPKEEETIHKEEETPKSPIVSEPEIVLYNDKNRELIHYFNTNKTLESKVLTADIDESLSKEIKSTKFKLETNFKNVIELSIEYVNFLKRHSDKLDECVSIIARKFIDRIEDNSNATSVYALAYVLSRITEIPSFKDKNLKLLFFKEFRKSINWLVKDEATYRQNIEIGLFDMILIWFSYDVELLEYISIPIIENVINNALAPNINKFYDKLDDINELRKLINEKEKECKFIWEHVEHFFDINAFIANTACHDKLANIENSIRSLLERLGDHIGAKINKDIKTPLDEIGSLFFIVRIDMHIKTKRYLFNSNILVYKINEFIKPTGNEEEEEENEDEQDKSPKKKKKVKHSKPKETAPKTPETEKSTSKETASKTSETNDKK